MSASAWAQSAGINSMPYTTDFSSVNPFDGGSVVDGSNVSSVLNVNNTTATATFNIEGNTPYVLADKEEVTVSFTAFHGWLGSGANQSVSLLNSEDVVLASYTYNLGSCNLTGVTVAGKAASVTAYNLQSKAASKNANGLDNGKSQGYVTTEGNNPVITFTVAKSGRCSVNVKKGAASIDNTYVNTADAGVKMDIAKIVITCGSNNGDRTICIDDLSITTGTVTKTDKELAIEAYEAADIEYTEALTSANTYSTVNVSDTKPFMRTTASAATFSAAVSAAETSYASATIADLSAASASDINAAAATISGLAGDIATATDTYAGAFNQPDGALYYRIYSAGSTLNINTVQSANQSIILTETPGVVKIVPVTGGYNIRDAYDNNFVHDKANNATWGIAGAFAESRGERFTATVNPDGTVTLTSAYSSIALSAASQEAGSYVGKSGAFSTWMVSEPVEVAEVAMAIAADKYSTFVAPFDVAIPADVKAYKATGVSGTTVVEEEITTTIPANTPVLLYSTIDKPTSFTGIKPTTASATEGILTGVYEATAVPVGSYVLQTQAGEQKFYIVGSAQPTLSANKAYLTVASSARELNIAEEATAIKAVNALVNGDAKIYDINGRELNALQKGINIVNGVKVLVK